MVWNITNPRIQLINDIIQSIVASEEEFSLMEYLQKIAVVCETDISTECVVAKDNQVIVFLNPNVSDDTLIRLIAQVRLNHVYVKSCPHDILKKEIDLFKTNYYKSCYKTLAL